MLRISGALKRLNLAQRKRHCPPYRQRIEPCLLVTDNFKGWEGGADWDDLDFYISHGRKISRIAIVAERR